jgi:hypothetical protein
LNMVTSEILSVFWKYLGQFFQKTENFRGDIQKSIFS